MATSDGIFVEAHRVCKVESSKGRSSSVDGPGERGGSLSNRDNDELVVDDLPPDLGEDWVGLIVVIEPGPNVPGSISSIDVKDIDLLSPEVIVVPFKIEYICMLDVVVNLNIEMLRSHAQIFEETLCCHIRSISFGILCLTTLSIEAA